jgi:hypothetical protein
VRSQRHQWHNWEQYQTVHDNTIATYLGHFILDDQVERVETPKSVVWAGILFCADAVEIKVDKRQDVRTRAGRLEVRTIDYTYHAYRRLGGDRVRNLLRYDNAHPHPDHPDGNHKHEYDDRGRDHVVHIGGDWPTLGQVIAEVHAWWMASVRP